MVQRRDPQDCLRHHEELPVKCQQLRKGLSDCKYAFVPAVPTSTFSAIAGGKILTRLFPRRGMVDMRKRFRGNQPYALTKEVDADTGEVRQSRKPVGQLYGGKPAFESVKPTSGDEVQMDPEKTRGL